MSRKRPDWKQVLDQEIERRRTKRTRSDRSVGVNMDAQQWKLIDRAAARRGMSVAAFVRRSALALAINDLGLDWDEVMKDEPSPRGYGNARYFNTRENAGGMGHGLWRIKEMR